jgi:O-antigen/teichoic acid export membrane protein
MRFISQLQRLTTSSLLSRILSGSLIVLAGDMLSRAISLVVKLRLAEALGVQRYGDYTALVTALAVLGSLLGFGLDTWLLREGGREPARLATNLRSVLLIKFGAALLLTIGLLLVRSQLSLSAAFVVGCIAILGDSLMGTSFSVLRAIRRYGLATLTQISQPLLLLLALLALQQRAASPLLILTLQALISAGALLAVLLLNKSVLRQTEPIDKHVVIQAALAAAPFVAADLLATIYSRSSTLILKLTSGSAPVGVFTPALDLLTTFYIVPAVVFGIALPILSRADLEPSVFKDTVRKLIWGAIGYGTLVCVLVLASAGVVFQRLYLPEFAAGADLLRIMSIAPLFKALSFVFAAIMLARQRQSLRMTIQAVVVIVNLVSTYALLSAFGANGSALTTVATEIVLMIGYGLGALAALRAQRLVL